MNNVGNFLRHWKRLKDVVHLSILEVLVRVCVRRDGTNCSNESNGVIPSAAFRDAGDLDVLHSVSILFSSLCSCQQFHFRVHCSSLQGAFFLVDKCSSSQSSQSEFSALNACVFSSEVQVTCLEKS